MDTPQLRPEDLTAVGAAHRGARRGAGAGTRTAAGGCSRCGTPVGPAASPRCRCRRRRRTTTRGPRSSGTGWPWAEPPSCATSTPSRTPAPWRGTRPGPSSRGRGGTDERRVLHPPVRPRAPGARVLRGRGGRRPGAAAGARLVAIGGPLGLAPAHALRRADARHRLRAGSADRGAGRARPRGPRDRRRARGGPADPRTAGCRRCVRNVFDALPGEGRWHSALLADGNVGIGGDPVALLAPAARGAGPARPGGRRPRRRPGCRSARCWAALQCDGTRSRPFRWAVVGADDIAALAVAAGFGDTVCHDHDGRWCAVLKEAA